MERSCLSPHGESGLKCAVSGSKEHGKRSLSTRREWVEILQDTAEKVAAMVSLHTERVG